MKKANTPTVEMLQKALDDLSNQLAEKNVELEKLKKAAKADSQLLAEANRRLHTTQETIESLRSTLRYTRAMWYLDRSSLLDNSGFWKQATERLVEANPGAVENGRDFLPFHPPSTRDTRSEVRDAALNQLAKAMKAGTAHWAIASDEEPEKKG